MNYCNHCGKETSNLKFCSRSCSAISTNKSYPKRKIERRCILCESPVKSYRHNRCEFHWAEWKSRLYINMTIGDCRSRSCLNGKPASWKNVFIRNSARRMLKDLLKLPCEACGYSKHVEICHIRPISDFQDHELVSAANSRGNVRILCPNCHWEFDNL
jgi:5-methylcytosine-specific restriction endonuclease McrA